MAFPSATIFVVAVVITCSLHIIIRRTKRLPLPPGPTGYPIIGNSFGADTHHLWLMFAKWTDIYGSDVLSYETYGRTTVILNSYKAVAELLEKRSYNYSDRPRQCMVDELLGWSWMFSHMRYGDWWRRHRRAFHQYFQPRNLAAYHPVLIKTTLTFLEQLSTTPDNYRNHIRQLVGSSVLETAYGYEVQAEDDRFIGLITRALEPLMESMHKSFLVDHFPLLKYVPAWTPGAGFKRKAMAASQDTALVPEVPFRDVKAQIANGTAKPSFVSDNLLHLMAGKTSIPADEEEIIKNCAAIMYTAGSDTTASLLLTWQLAMIHYPEVQKRAQIEIDRVCGLSRLPDFSDRPSTPYVEATMLEAMRWHAISPLSLPHRAVDEDEYEGYRIPAGATVTPNAWAILHDPELYPDPFTFSPERFLDDKQEKVAFEKQPDPNLTGAFGFGRRLCPGRHFALSAGWIAIASILATYSLTKARNAEGQVIEEEITFGDGLMSHPDPYRIRYEVRSKDVPNWIDTAKMTT